MPIRTFEVEAFKVGIVLTDKDSDFMISHFTEPNRNQYLKYEDVIKELNPIVQSDGTM